LRPPQNQCTLESKHFTVFLCYKVDFLLYGSLLSQALPVFCGIGFLRRIDFSDMNRITSAKQIDINNIF
jgi:hypothetical protein